MGRHKVDRTPALPSLYTFNALSLPPITSHYDPKSAPAPAKQDLHHLVSLTERGGAGTFLHSVLQESYEREVKRRKAAAARSDLEEEEDEDERELREKGFVHKKRPPPPRRRTRSMSAASVGGSEGEKEPTTGLEGDDEEGSETAAAADGDEEGEEGRGSKKRRKRTRREGTKRMERIREGLKVPDVRVEEVDLPEGAFYFPLSFAKEVIDLFSSADFPSSDLLHSLHAHTASHLRSTHSLLPALTRSSPFLPPEHRAHFDALSARYNAEEEKAALEGTARNFAAWKKTRVSRSGAGMRKGVWTDAAAAFEGSALVAMGMLAKLLAEDAVQQASSRSPSSCPETPAHPLAGPSAS